MEISIVEKLNKKKKNTLNSHIVKKKKIYYKSVIEEIS